MKKVVRYIAVLLGTLFIAAIVIELTGSLSSDSINDSLSNTAIRINKDLPRQMNKNARFDSVSSSDHEFNYYYTILTYKKSNLDLSYFKNKVRPKLSENYCNDEKSKPYRENNVSANFWYYDKNGLFITKIKIISNQCK